MAPVRPATTKCRAPRLRRKIMTRARTISRARRCTRRRSTSGCPRPQQHSRCRALALGAAGVRTITCTVAAASLDCFARTVGLANRRFLDTASIAAGEKEKHASIGTRRGRGLHAKKDLHMGIGGEASSQRTRSFAGSWYFASSFYSVRACHF